jgi:hypothetical protein
MSGSSTNPILDVEDLLGPNQLGDTEMERLNQALNDLAEGLDDADAPVDDLVAALEQAAEDVGLAFDQLREDLAAAADEAEDAVQEVLDTIEDALSEAGIIDGGGDGNGDGNGNGDGDGNGNGGGAVPQSAFALLLPANNSGALGFAAVRLDGNTLDVRFVANNVTLGEPHPLHIHGFTDDGTERLAVASDDADGDGFVETAEGAAAAFGPIIASLTASGDVDPALGGSGDFDVAEEDGRIVFSRSYTLDPNDAEDQDVLTALQDQLEGRVIKLHGLEVAEGAGEGTPGEVNGEGGYADLLPVAAGQLLSLPDEVVAQFADDPEALLDGITAFLDAIAPFTLNTDGSGAIAPDPFLADDANGDVTNGDGTNGDVTNGDGTNGDVTNGDGTNGNIANGDGVLPVAVNGDNGTDSNGNGTDGQGDGARSFATLILPANNSGVFGAASITFDEAAGTVAIDLDLAGLEPGEAHAMHIHGFTDDSASLLPNISLDADLDGFVEASEGASVIGQVLLGLTGDGSITDASLIGDWPEADENGFLSLEQTYSFDLDDAAEAALFGELQDRMEGRLIQVHGLSVDAAQGEGTRGEVAGEAGYQPLLAVAHGAILSTDTEGGAFAAEFGALLQAALDAQAAEAGTAPVTPPLQDALIA